MTRRSVNLIEFWLRIGFFLIPAAAFSVAGYVRFMTGYFASGPIEIRAYVTLTILVTLLWALVVQHLQLDRIDTLLRVQTGVRMAGLATSYCTVLVLAVLFFYRGESFARAFVGLGCVLMFVLSLGMIHVLRGLIYAATKSANGRLPIAILGADELGTAVARHLAYNLITPCKVACFVALPGQDCGELDAPVVTWDRLDDVLGVFHCQEILVAVPLDRLGKVEDILTVLQRLCIPARIVLHSGHGLVMHDRIFDFCGLPLLDVREYPNDSLRYAVGKRFFDIIFSLFVLAVLSPLMAMIAVAIRLTSRGPVFFVQERIGLSGGVFRMYKFRTMRTATTAESDVRWTTSDDPRCTALGRWLRKTSLDELPQFFNVLKGDMSVVGPRPERPHFVREFQNSFSHYNNRHYLKVGITGWAQVNGWRGDTSIQKRVEYDLFYLRHWSMVLDLKIIFLTVFKGLIDRNAY